LKQLSIGGSGLGNLVKRNTVKVVSFANVAVGSDTTKPNGIGPNVSKPKGIVSSPIESTEIGVNVSKSKEILSNGSKPQETGLIASKYNGIVSIASKPNENGPTSTVQLSQMVGNQKISVTPVFSFTFL
jgi:hypothetical protein